MEIVLKSEVLMRWPTLAVPALIAAQEFEFHPPVYAGDAATAAIMRDLAVRILPVYQENDPERYLENLSALQLTSGDYAAAYATQQSLRERRQNAYPDRLDLSDVHLRLVKQLGGRIVVNTDAHHIGHLDKIRYGVRQLRRAWLTRDDVLNTLPVDGFLAALRPRPAAD